MFCTHCCLHGRIIFTSGKERTTTNNNSRQQEAVSGMRGWASKKTDGEDPARNASPAEEEPGPAPAASPADEGEGSDEEKLSWTSSDDSHLLLGNLSKYRVSYSVLQEDKRKTTAISKRLNKRIECSLNAAASGTEGVVAGLGAGMTREKEVTKEQTEVPHYLLRDHRIDGADPPHDSQGTKVSYSYLYLWII